MKYGRSGPLFTDGNRTYRSLKSETVQYGRISKKKTHTEVRKENQKRENREKEKGKNKIKKEKMEKKKKKEGKKKIEK